MYTLYSVRHDYFPLRELDYECEVQRTANLQSQGKMWWCQLLYFGETILQHLSRKLKGHPQATGATPKTGPHDSGRDLYTKKWARSIWVAKVASMATVLRSLNKSLAVTKVTT